MAYPSLWTRTHYAWDRGWEFGKITGIWAGLALAIFTDPNPVTLLGFPVLGAMTGPLLGAVAYTGATLASSLIGGIFRAAFGAVGLATALTVGAIGAVGRTAGHLVPSRTPNNAANVPADTSDLEERIAARSDARIERALAVQRRQMMEEFAERYDAPRRTDHAARVEARRNAPRSASLNA